MPSSPPNSKDQPPDKCPSDGPEMTSNPEKPDDQPSSPPINQPSDDCDEENYEYVWVEVPETEEEPCREEQQSVFGGIDDFSDAFEVTVDDQAPEVLQHLPVVEPDWPDLDVQREDDRQEVYSSSKSLETFNLLYADRDDTQVPEKDVDKDESKLSKPSITGKELQEAVELAASKQAYSPILCALANLGFTCYVNSVVQMLYNWDIVNQYIMVHSCLGKFHNALAALFGEMEDEAIRKVALRQTPIVEPQRLITEFRAVRPQFQQFQYQDAQEYFTILLDILHQEVNQVRKLSLEEKTLQGEPKSAQQAWEFHVLYVDRSFFSHLLMGQVETELTCLSCGHRSLSWSCIWQLQLEVEPEVKSKEDDNLKTASAHSEENEQNAPPKAMNNTKLTLESCIKEYTSDETLQSDCAPQCSGCQQRHSARKRLSICRPPPYLLVHLKRFAPDGTKIYRQVQIAPKFTLDLTNSDRQAYHLQSCILHVGSETNGHYGAILHHQVNNKWSGIEDTEIHRDMPHWNATSLISKMAYLCLFRAAA